MKKILLLFLTALLYSCNFPGKPDSEDEAGTKDQNQLHLFSSEFLHEEVPYQIFIPEGLDSEKDSISLLVLLDGDEYFGLAQDVTSLYKSGGKIKPTVVVSLPSTPKSRWSHYTPTRDSINIEEGFEELYRVTGRFPEFASFVEQELIPHIQEKQGMEFYKKTIFGHSLGGLGVLSFAVLRPEIFDNYISASPSTMFDDHFIFKALEDKGSMEFKSLYLTAALNDANGYRQNVEWLKEYLDQNKNENQSVGIMIYENENHTTSGLRSLIDGLSFSGEH